MDDEMPQITGIEPFRDYGEPRRFVGYSGDDTGHGEGFLHGPTMQWFYWHRRNLRLATGQKVAHPGLER